MGVVVSQPPLENYIADGMRRVHHCNTDQLLCYEGRLYCLRVLLSVLDDDYVAASR